MKVTPPMSYVRGYSARKRLLFLYFKESTNERIRVISARSATRREQRDYEENVTN